MVKKNQDSSTWRNMVSYLMLALAASVGMVIVQPISEPDVPKDGTRERGTASPVPLEEADVESSRLESVSDVRSPWSPVDPDTRPRLAPSLPLPVDHAVLVKLDGAIGDWRVGDRIRIHVPQTQTKYSSTVERIDAALGRRSYRGRLRTDGAMPYSFVITVGPGSTFGTIITPEGAFEMTGNASFAWLMSTREMYAQLPQMPPDYYIPPRFRDRL